MSSPWRFARALSCCVAVTLYDSPEGFAASIARSIDAPPASWEEGPGYRRLSLTVPPTGRTGFTRMNPTDTGILFSNRLSHATVATNRLLEIGSGVALGDVDGDGRTDVYFCGLENANALYRNLGNWRFEEITEHAGVACVRQFSTGCLLADLDGDGDLDLLVNSLGGGTRVFFNDGRGQFTERTDTGLFRRFGATSFAMADIEGDGDLDLYVTNYRTDTFFDSPRGLRMEMRQQPDGTRVLEPRERFLALTGANGSPTVLERGEPDVLYVNRGGGRFMPISWNSGLFLDENGAAIKGAPTDWGLSVMFRDLNNDGWPDLYVCNDFVGWPDRLWLNEGGRRFRAAPATALRCVSLASMAVDVADINRDGLDDIVVADMLNPRREFRAWQRPDMLNSAVQWPLHDPQFRPEVPRNTLHIARGDGTFAEIARMAGVAATDWTTALLFMDVDLDGWEDLLVGTGNLHDVQDADALGTMKGGTTWADRLRNLSRLPDRHAPSLAFRNRGDLTFEDVSASWGFNEHGVVHGFALGDLDGDGDLDVVMNAMNAPARIYRNDSDAPRVAVSLRGSGANTRGIGAQITVRGGPVTQTQQVIAGGRYASSDDPMRVFAAGTARELEIEVRWRSGAISRVPALPNHRYEILESGAGKPGESPPPRGSPLFEDHSDRVAARHVHESFDDFARQPLLPRKLSTFGPGVTWADCDRDGDDDLILGAGRSGRTVILRNDNGVFRERRELAFPGRSTSRDQTTLLFVHGPDGTASLIAGESNWTDANPDAPAFRVWDFTAGKPAETTAPFPSGEATTGPMAMADVDGDGDLDLFLGGRTVPARYPEPASSRFFRRDPDGFKAAQSLPIKARVSGAVFTDWDGDGDPDLALACDWDAVRLFRNENGTFHEVTETMGLANLVGCWNGIASGDFDGDGRLDLVASNWGRNWRTDQPPGKSLAVHVFHGEFAGDGCRHTLLASIEPWLGKVTPWRERKALVAAIPFIAARTPDHHTYGRSSVAEVLGDALSQAEELKATCFDSMVFLNRGDRFEAIPLPAEAQVSPGFGISVADFNGDGHEDIFLAQNFFGVDAETSRHDAGVGAVLLGDGTGRFRALPPLESGISLVGEQRGTAVADFDGDGRMDLVVGVHSGNPGLFRNARAQPGVRVRLRGDLKNPAAIGAGVRLRFGDRLGPARELRAGSGFWSQDSITLVMSAPATPDSIWIRWPGGRVQEHPWPENARHVEVSYEGVRSLKP